ncbi:dsDNA nuclease domain-containing protein [Marinifilum flexuosum]|uniref:Uncharacterized protein DUF4297 n=1 Tax=Marinifilum flexuosum TaxID=1117708 RepID=A0A419WFF7_9BACT|nr:dsDNA nuclease domain-containing protein [Marinifilum flexuosum]RKD94086.1 uncharacterized protein DUF4297 [Marinifilum flexuosum]
MSSSAAKTIIGFDYQYYYFLYLLLNLKQGEKIGYEVKDDIHLDKHDGKKILLQLKHTLDSEKNLTEKDSDLWKTLYNWLSDIKKIETRDERIQEIKSTSYVLVTNKKFSSQNELLVKLGKLQISEIDYSEFEQYVKSLNSSNDDIKKYMEFLQSLPKYLLINFFNQISFSFSVDEIIDKIELRLQELFIKKEYVSDVFSCLDSNIRKDFYLTTKSHGINEISFNDFQLKYVNCFNFGRTNRLPIREFDDAIPLNPLNQLFIKQLVEIGDVDSSEEDIIREYTRLKLLMYNNLKTWNIKGELTTQQSEKFTKNCLTIWRSLFRESHRQNIKDLSNGLTVDDIQEKIEVAGLNCLNEIRKLELTIDGEVLDYEVSNGQFYLLSDIPSIGWHVEWKKKYLDEK